MAPQSQLEIGYTFRNEQLRQNALTHSSYANENREKGARSNERLEFLGDAVLGFICAEYIYAHFRSMPEGELTKLRASIVCEKSLHEYALRLRLGERLLLGHGEEAGGGRKRPSVLADAVEAMLAAIYLDGGMEAARQLVLRCWPKPEDVHRPMQDSKGALQEYLQQDGGNTPVYETIGQSGPPHDRQFEAAVFRDGQELGRGSGRTKKQAEQAAALNALRRLGQAGRA